MFRAVLLVAVIIFTLLLIVPGALTLPVIDRDEAHFAQASRQMLQSDQYFQIRFQDKTRFQKPPGINWLQAASVRAVSDADDSRIWPYRLPSLLGAVFAVLFTYLLGTTLMRREVAAIAAMLLASTLLLVFEADIAVIDASLLFSVMAMQLALWIIYRATDEVRPAVFWPLIFWSAMAFGFVLKGVTPLVGGLSVAALCLFEKNIRWLKTLRLIPGLLLFAAFSLWWLAKVNEAEQSNYFLQMLHKDLLPKLQGGHESHGKPPLFHLLILPLTFWPASLFLWQAGVFAYTERKQRAVRFLIAWIVPTWLFFELMPTKLPQYVLPTFPAIALLAAMAIEQAVITNPKPSRWLHCLQAGWLLMSVVLLLLLASIPYIFHTTLSITALILLGFALTCITGATIYAWRGRFKGAMAATALASLVTYPLVFTEILPAQKALWVSRNIASAVASEAFSARHPLAVNGFEEPSLVFYFNTHNVRFQTLDSLAEYLRCNPVHRGLIKRSDLEQLTLASPMPLQQYAEVAGFNYSKGKWVDLVVVGQNKENKTNDAS